MKSSSVGSALLQRAYNRLYTGKLRRLIRRLGLNKILSEPYWKLVYTLSKDKKTYSISNQTITFQIKTFSEFMRFKEFKGEREIIEATIESLNPDDVFYDIGANVGMYTCFAAAKLQSGHVVAFEPESGNFRRLQENLRLNGLNAELIDVALSDTDGTIEFKLRGKETGEGEHSIATEDETDTIKVETARTDSIIKERGLPKPSVVKIDVEGAEMSVLRGMQNTLKGDCRIVYVEVHPSEIEKYEELPDAVQSLLKKTGFEVTELAERGGEYFVKGIKQNDEDSDG